MVKGSRNVLLHMIILSHLLLSITAVSSESVDTISSTIPLETGWEYSWNAFPRDSSGSLIWDMNSIDSLPWQRIDFPSNPPDRQGRHLVWFRIRLPDTPIRDPALFIFSIDINAEFFIDGTRIHSFGTIDKDGVGKFIGWPVQLIELPSDCMGKDLFVRVFSDYRDIGLWGKILIGNNANILGYMYQRDFFGIIAFIISMLIGFIFFVTFVLARKQKISLHLSIITFLLAIRIFSQLYIHHRVILSSIHTEHIDAMTFALIPFFITMTIRSFLDGKYRKLTHFLLCVYILLTATVLAVWILPGIVIHSVYFLLDIGSLLGVATLGYISVRCLIQGTVEQKYISVNFLIMACLVLYSILMSYSILPWVSEFDYLMVLQFSIGLAIILGYRFFVLYSGYENQSVELATMNKKLEIQVSQRTTELEEANRKLAEVNTRLKREKNLLKVSSITDGLTGLYNRTYVEEQYLQFTRESSRYGRSFSIAMLDLDHFKHVNDEFGHFVGDEVLRKVSETFRDHIRETDIVGRYGGEEFLLLFPQTDHAEAMVVTERIREHIANLSFEHGPGRITISGGIAQFGGQSAEELLAEADKNLYAAKQGGRNRIV